MNTLTALQRLQSCRNNSILLQACLTSTINIDDRTATDIINSISEEWKLQHITHCPPSKGIIQLQNNDGYVYIQDFLNTTSTETVFIGWLYLAILISVNYRYSCKAINNRTLTPMTLEGLYNHDCVSIIVPVLPWITVERNAKRLLRNTPSDDIIQLINCCNRQRVAFSDGYTFGDTISINLEARNAWNINTSKRLSNLAKSVKNNKHMSSHFIPKKHINLIQTAIFNLNTNIS